MTSQRSKPIVMTPASDGGSDRNIPHRAGLQTAARRAGVDLVVNARFRALPLLVSTAAWWLFEAAAPLPGLLVPALLAGLSGSHLRVRASARL
ncbi:hypothetical protein ACIOJE_27095 [Kitasatospora sp. NPDC087861]|uniref:hypothetical protein n=1 Tax=Kitasatospora sp. NPDC087861 TaxID=3364070 RepID=UPI0037F1B670